MTGKRRHATKFAETAQEATESATSTIFTLRNIAIFAGAAILLPYLVRRVMPLLKGDMADISGRDLEIAGKDSVRDAADDLGVGGVTGTMKRGVGRVADRLQQ